MCTRFDLGVATAAMLVLIGSEAHGMSELNMGQYIEDAFLLQFRTVDEINKERDFQAQRASPTLPPEVEWDLKTALMSSRPVMERGHWASCSDFHFLSYNDYRALQKGRGTMPVWGLWNTPISSSVDMTRGLRGGIRRLKASVAVAGEVFRIANVIDPKEMTFTPATFEGLHQIEGYGFERIETPHLKGKKITVVGEVECGKFSIFHLEVG
jgi:hypothetical protein